ncbi:MAG: glycoside hydrolase family 15 protein [Trueperaceae bacterium]
MADLRGKLEPYYTQVNAMILSRQHPVSGLLPASTAVNEHGDYRDAWVRDNVYSILAVWALALAYRKLDNDEGRGYELEHAVIKLMRGLLVAMMQQAPKVEAFKKSQNPLDALHAKYNTATGDTVVPDDAWGHLQLDATSLYLLMLAQMISSGLDIIHTLDEVNFVQNLIFYISRSYRTPDYGIWERGDKTNHGESELNASSVALAKAALEALAGFNLFGVRGSQASVLHVLPDDIARSKIVLEAMLPRESRSKEIDAALLGAISFPAFAVEDTTLVERTRNDIITKLSGKYGLKRFLKDGHQSVLEDIQRLHYKSEELKQFEHIESEWPLFFAYLMLDGCFFGNFEQVETYSEKLKTVAVTRNGFSLLPELYYVPIEGVDAERSVPGSQPRNPNDNVPLVWAQSLWLLAQLLQDKLVTVFDIDPLGRHQQLDKTSQPVVQLALVVEDKTLQETLANQGIPNETLEQIRPIRLERASQITRAYEQIGRNEKLGLSGRPSRRLLSLSTSRIFRLRGELIVCPPSSFDEREFYLSLDTNFLIERLRAEISYVQRTWSLLGRPTMTLFITKSLYEDEEGALQTFLDEVRQGWCGEGVNRVAIKLAPLKQLVQTANLERVDNLHDFDFIEIIDDTVTTHYLKVDTAHIKSLTADEEVRLELEVDTTRLEERLRQSQNVYEHVEILSILTGKLGLKASIQGLATVEDLLEEVYQRASELRLWAAVRRAAGLLEKVDFLLSDSVTDLLVKQKTIVIGKSYSERSLLTRPVPLQELLTLIKEFCREDIRDRVLTQEILIYLGSLVRSSPELFTDLMTIRVGFLIVLLASDVADELNLTPDEGYEQLMHLAPSEIQKRLKTILSSYADKQQRLQRRETMRAYQVEREQILVAPLEWFKTIATLELDPKKTNDSWWRWRQREGSLSLIPNGFYSAVWELLKHCQGIIIGDKLERRNRLESNVLLSEMTPGESNFAMRVEHLLNKIPSPEYRQLSVEAMMALHRASEQNPALQVQDYIVLDVIIGHAVRLAYMENEPYSDYEKSKAAAWATFYERPPKVTSRQIVAAFEFLLSGEKQIA